MTVSLCSCSSSNYAACYLFATWLVHFLWFLDEHKKQEDDEEEPLAGKDEEERRIAEMGRPMLGDHVKLEVIIEESYEFKVRQGCVLVWLDLRHSGSAKQ